MNAPTRPAHAPLLEVEGLRKVFRSRGLLRRRPQVVANDDVAFQVARGEAVALVGESGSGKSTVAKLILRLHTADGGQIRLDGEDILAREPKGASLAYRRRVQMVFQDPFGSLNPVHDVAYHLERPLLRHRRAARSQVRQRSLELLRTVGLEPAEDFIDRHPYELSGGQRQRVAIARALAPGPDLLVADEPTSMLDVSIRTGILNLLLQLKTEHQLGILLITHDLASARYLADRILVMFAGRVVEDGPSDAVIREPSHPYTRALLDSIADGGAPGEGAAAEAALRRERVSTGCPFAPRCPEVMETCWTVEPEPLPYRDRRVRCHLHAHPVPAGEVHER